MISAKAGRTLLSPHISRARLRNNRQSRRLLSSCKSSLLHLYSKRRHNSLRLRSRLRHSKMSTHRRRLSNSSFPLRISSSCHSRPLCHRLHRCRFSRRHHLNRSNTLLRTNSSCHSRLSCRRLSKCRFNRLHLCYRVRSPSTRRSLSKSSSSSSSSYIHHNNLMQISNRLRLRCSNPTSRSNRRSFNHLPKLVVD